MDVSCGEERQASPQAANSTTGPARVEVMELKLKLKISYTTVHRLVGGESVKRPRNAGSCRFSNWPGQSRVGNEGAKSESHRSLQR